MGDELTINEFLNFHCFKIHELEQRNKIKNIIPIDSGEVGDIWKGVRKCKDFKKNKKYITSLGDNFRIKKLNSKKYKFLEKPAFFITEFIHINNIPCIILSDDFKK